METLIDDAQQLFQEAASATEGKADELHSKGMGLLDTALSRVRAQQTKAIEKGKRIAACANDEMHANPWRTALLLAGAGIVLGFLSARKER